MVTILRSKWFCIKLSSVLPPFTFSRGDQKMWTHPSGDGAVTVLTGHFSYRTAFRFVIKQQYFQIYFQTLAPLSPGMGLLSSAIWGKEGVWIRLTELFPTIQASGPLQQFPPPTVLVSCIFMVCSLSFILPWFKHCFLSESFSDTKFQHFPHNEYLTCLSLPFVFFLLALSTF